MFHFVQTRQIRRPSLTPMIDVVFLLLVFFMLAARFGTDVSLPLTTAGADAPVEGPPRLVQLSASGLTLNGLTLTLDALPSELKVLSPAAEAPVFLQPSQDVPLQRMIDVIDALVAAGLTQIVVVPPQ